MENVIIDEKIGDTMLRGRLRGLPGLKYDITFCPGQITICNYSPYMGEMLTTHYKIADKEATKLPNGDVGTLYTCKDKKATKKIYVAADESHVYIA